MQSSNPRRLHTVNDALPELTSQLSCAMLEQIRQAVGSGRLDVAMLLLERLRAVVPDAGASVHEWSGFLEQCRAAGRAVAAGQPRPAAAGARKSSAS